MDNLPPEASSFMKYREIPFSIAKLKSDETGTTN